jgi:hypothetical protein
MGNLTVSQANNIWSPNGNSLAVFVDGVSGILKLKDALGNVQPFEDYVTVMYGTGGIYSQTANSTPITATTSELTLIDGGVGTLNVPANGFSVGDSYIANLSGIMSAKNNNSLIIRIKSGNVVLAESQPLVMPAINNQVWNLQVNFTIRTIGGANIASIVTAGEMHVLKLASGTQEGFGFSAINNTTFNTTILNTLNITAQWSSTDVQNSIYTNLFVLTKIY